jgi:hypothetical protein
MQTALIVFKILQSLREIAMIYMVLDFEITKNHWEFGFRNLEISISLNYLVTYILKTFNSDNVAIDECTNCCK